MKILVQFQYSYSIDCHIETRSEYLRLCVRVEGFGQLDTRGRERGGGRDGKRDRTNTRHAIENEITHTRGKKIMSHM